jgi:hypothetical protein
MHTQFLYVIVREVVNGNRTGKYLDTQLRIVYWPETEDSAEHFVIYGTRPYSKHAGNYIPYRLVCNTKEQVFHFAETMIGIRNNVEISIHQFSGENDDTIDEYNIEWDNTNENESTELVTYDVSPGINSYGQFRLDFKKDLYSGLNIISDFCVV